MIIDSFKNIKFIYNLFDNKHKTKIYFVFINSIIIVLLETLSISAFIPFFDILFSQNSNFNSSSSHITKYIFNLFSDYKFNDMVILLSLLLITIFIIKIFITILLNYLNLVFQKNLQLYLDHIVTEIHFSKNYEKIKNLKKSEITRNILTEPGYVLKYLSSFLTIMSELLIVTVLIYLILISSLQGMTSILIIMGSGILIFYFSYKKLLKWGQVRLKAASLIIKSIIDPFSNFAEVKILRLEAFFLHLFKVSRAKLLTTTMNLTFLQSLNRYILELCLVSSLLLILIFLAKSSTFDLYEILPSFLSIGVIALRILPSVNKLVSQFQNIKFVESALSNFKKIMIGINEYSKDKNKVLLDNFNSFEIKNINFSYEGSTKNILENLSIKIKKNEKVAIYGDSGSGKSTLGKIIAGLLNPQSGTIIYNDNINNFFDCKWGNKLSYVPAESFLWEGNLLNNITLNFFDTKYDQVKMNKIIKICKLENFLSKLENGLLTEIKDGGKNFSSGQVQRIAIARHLYQYPEFLILDESTNALDKELQKEILTNLLKMEDITILIISHDKQVIKMFSTIYNFSNKNIQLTVSGKV